MDDRVAQRLIAAGGRADGFAARQVTADLIRAADLVLCATRDHRAAVVRMEPAALQRTFALADFADLAMAFPDPLPLLDLMAGTSSLIRGLVALVPRYRTSVTPRTAAAAAITDPFRQSDRLVSRMVHEIDALLPPIEAVLRSALLQAN